MSSDQELARIDAQIAFLTQTLAEIDERALLCEQQRDELLKRRQEVLERAQRAAELRCLASFQENVTHVVPECYPEFPMTMET